MIHLDTSFLVMAVSRGTPQAELLRSWLRAGEAMEICALAWGEFMCGPVSDEEIALARTLLPQPQPLEVIDAELGAELFNATGRRRGSFSDCLIAAFALGHDARLATANPSDFVRFEAKGLKLIDVTT